MVPDYDDDDIIEDYDEITDNSGARRVSSGQGGPVRRPSNGVRPSTTAMPAVQGDPNDPNNFNGPPKGKISHKSAKLIWIICIVIVVLGVGAVLADIIFDPLGRGKSSTPAQNNAATANNNRSMPPRNNKSPEEIMQDEFRSAVIGMMRDMDASKAWDFYWTSVLEFDHAFDKMIEVKNQEGASDEDIDRAYAEAIKHYYKAKYSAELFRHHFDQDNISKEYMAINIGSDDVKMLTKEELKNPKIQRFQAAYSKIDSKSTRVNKFKTDILKYDLRAQKIHDESPEWEASTFGEYKKRWETSTSTSPPEFAQEDLDFVNSGDYKASETKLWQKFLEEHPPE
ncbi:MAG: hypothetical protein KDB68_01500 [Planctomycetes bacterium]|nr:hypothetical protein [Planctomycetota bacterium]MCA8934855.1 hypothetical protein [Planctomycetota bacterium]